MSRGGLCSKKAEDALWTWYLDWSQVARTAVTQRVLLRQLGFNGWMGGDDFRDWMIPPGKVLAIGDHRGDSLDARKWGLIEERDLYGRAIAVYYRSSGVELHWSSPLQSLEAVAGGVTWKRL